MVKKVKRFVVFILFSMFFQLFHSWLQSDVNKEEGLNLIPSAEAKCCPPDKAHLDSDGNCY